MVLLRSFTDVAVSSAIDSANTNCPNGQDDIRFSGSLKKVQGYLRRNTHRPALLRRETARYRRDR